MWLPHANVGMVMAAVPLASLGGANHRAVVGERLRVTERLRAYHGGGEGHGLGSFADIV